MTKPNQKIAPILLVLLVAFLMKQIKSEVAYNFCEDRLYSSHFEYACCKGQQIELGIDFSAGWRKCSAEATPANETITETMWRVYSCIIKGGVKSRTLTLKKFAQAMSSKYPSAIKNAIMEFAGQVTLNTGDMSAIEKLNAIRVTYHNIESGVCTGNYTEVPLNELTSCSRGSDIYREATFRGDCCLGQSLPITLSFLRRQASAPVQECTKDLMVQAGTLHKYDFQNGVMKITATAASYETKTKYTESDARQMCLESCIIALDILEIIMDYTRLPFNYNEFIANVTRPFSGQVKEKIVSKFQDKFQEQVENVVFYAKPRIVETEFNRQANHTFLKKVLTTCESYNLGVRKIETALYELCRQG